MATNEIYNELILSLAASHPTSPSSGNPCRVGKATGVALTDEDSDGNTTIDFKMKVWDLSVKAENDSGNSAVSLFDALYYVDADVDDGTGTLSKKDSGYFFGYALEAISSGETDTIRVMKMPNSIPGELDIPGVIGTEQLEDAAVTADKIAAAIAGDGLAGGAGTALSVTVDDSTIEIDTDTLQVKDAGITAAKIADDILNGAKVAEVADDNVIGGIPVIFRILLGSGANANHDVTVTNKVRVIDAWNAMKGAGTAGSTVTVQNNTNAISDAMDCSSAGDKDVVRAGEIDDAYHEIAAGGTLRVATASSGGDFPGAECYVMALRVA